MLVYLDIDGVLIPERTPDQTIDRSFGDRLWRILDETRAKLVISSHRRRAPHQVAALLATVGITDYEFYQDGWMTPLDLNPLDDDLSVRGQEIDAHVSDHDVEDYVILDDSPVLSSQADRHIQPDPAIGLTDAHVDRAIAILLR